MPPADLFDNAVDRRQTKTRSLVLRRKKRLENPFAYFGGHPATCIAHRKSHIMAGGYPHVGASVNFIQVCIGRLNDELSSVGHGVSGINGQIENRLFNLPWVSPDAIQLRCLKGDQFNVLADDPPEHLIKILHQEIEVDELHFQDLTPAEGKKLSC